MVCGEEVVGGQSAEGRPLQGVEDVVVQLSGEVVYHEELKVDGGTVAVAVTNLRDAASDDGLDAELLLEFTDEGLLGSLTVFDFATGKLPFEAHGLVWAALADEDFGAAGLVGGLAQDQGRGHQPNRFAARVAASVQFANTLFHVGVYLSSLGYAALQQLNLTSLDAFIGCSKESARTGKGAIRGHFSFDKLRGRMTSKFGAEKGGETMRTRYWAERRGMMGTPIPLSLARAWLASGELGKRVMRARS